MNEPLITVAIVSWLLEERLIKTLQSIPKTTSLPLNLCLHVQGDEQVPFLTKQRILEAASGFVEKDIYFSTGNGGIAPPRAMNLKRAAKTPFVFMSDNDMDYQQGTLDAELEFLQTHPEFGMVDVMHNQLVYHRTVDGTKVICTSIETIKEDFAEVDLIGGTSQLIRQEVALIPDIIDIRYFIGSWDFDFAMNVRAAGWKIATLTDRNLIAFNDKSMRSDKYTTSKSNNEVIQRGRRLFEAKWGFSCMWFPRNRIKVDPLVPIEVSVISRAIYNKVGPLHAVGTIDKKHLELMQRNFINSLKAQTDQNFSLYLAVGPEDNEVIKQIQSLDWGNLNIKFLYTSGDLSQWESSIKRSRNWARETDSGSPEDIVRSLEYPRTSIMARMDIDDWVAPGWIAHMRYMANTMKENRFLINYQVFGQAPDGQIYEFYAPHVKRRTSPFIAIVQKEDITTDIYETVHLQMGKLFDIVYTIPPSYAFMVVHGGNRSNQVYEADRFSYTRETIESQTKAQVQPKEIPKPSLISQQVIAEPVKIKTEHIEQKIIRRSWREKLSMIQQSVQ
jgi:GT2 family glycosyltransferase